MQSSIIWGRDFVKVSVSDFMKSIIESVTDTCIDTDQTGILRNMFIHDTLHQLFWTVE
jgi:hypothetical protein